jgi:replicative DNA helicase
MDSARIDIEKNIIGSLITHSDLMNQCSNLQPDDFYNDRHKRIFEVMRELYNQGNQWDLTIIHRRCSELYGSFVEAGYLSILMDQTITSPILFPQYLNIFKKERLKGIVPETINRIGTDDPIALMDSLQESVTKIESDFRPKTAKEISLSLYNRFEIGAKNNGELSGVPTGLKNLDDLMWGLQPGRLYIIAARPSVGKSALATNIAVNAALQGKRPYIQSLEETTYSIGSRIISRFSEIPNEILNKNKIGDNQWPFITKAVSQFAALDLVIDDTSGLSSSQIVSRVRQEHSKKPIDLVIVDHLQEIRENIRERRLEVSRATSALKGLAKALQIPVICLCQLSRAASTDSDQTPKLFHLKESGDVEAIADVVMLLNRESYHNNETKPVDEMEILVAKNRDGKTGTINLSWKPSTLTFS